MVIALCLIPYIAVGIFMYGFWRVDITRNELWILAFPIWPLVLLYKVGRYFSIINY